MVESRRLKAADSTMAQPNSAQREPSMEEILASIRRIIEDSDNEKRRDDDNAAMGSPANDVAGDADSMAAFRSELSQSSNFDDRSISENDESKSAVVDRSDEAADVAFDVEELTEVTDFAQPPIEQQTADLDVEASSSAGDAAPTASGVVEHADATSAEEPVGRVESRSDLVEPQRSSLVSERAERQVSAAFGELSEAFAASRRRSFDEMAEEMLRPMLQDWLDNNLPHLVERLVREEIERIARA